MLKNWSISTSNGVCTIEDTGLEHLLFRPCGRVTGSRVLVAIQEVCCPVWDVHKETRKGSKGPLAGKREAKWISDFRLLMIRYDTISKLKLEHEGDYETLQALPLLYAVCYPSEYPSNPPLYLFLCWDLALLCSCLGR